MSELSPQASARSVGVTGSARSGSLAEAVAAGPGWWPLVVLGASAGGLLVQGVTLLLAPALAVSLGGTTEQIAAALLFWGVGAVLGLPFALRAGLSAKPMLSAAVGGSLVSLGLCLVAAADGRGLIIAAALLAGIGSVIASSTHRGILADLYPPLALTHVTAAFHAVVMTVAALSLIVVFPLVAGLGLTVQAGLLLVALIVGVPSVALAAFQEPGAGAPERTYLRRLVKAEQLELEPARRPSFAEALRRLYAIPTVRPMLALVAVLSSMGYGVIVFGSYALTERGGITELASRWVLVGAAVSGAVVVLDQGGRASSLLRESPAALARWASAVTLAAGGAVVALALLPWALGQAFALLVAAAALITALAAVDRLLALVVPPDLRGAVGAVAATYGAVLGVGLGGSVLAGLEGSKGLSLGLSVLGAAGGVAALVLRAVGRQIGADVSAAVGSAVEALESAREMARGVRPPLLTCRGINFSYGPLQILFDVDFTVDDGEMVALLGTNGAGKSTLLRVISGLGLPSSGTIRVAGQDVTYAEPGDRVRQGICQIPGGKAVFGPLSVVENLRLYGYALGRDKKTVDRGIEESFTTFPRLAERRNASASTMSGGEQQMLALSKALILQPRLLLIDELSLGLAPKVVGELLTLVRSINDKGTSVVLVEQSVNVALSLAEHAYFMEKGQVRFDGRTQDLLARPDILRSVFLSGVAAGASS